MGRPRKAIVCWGGAAVLLFLVPVTGVAKTRWSSLRMAPDADLLPGGEFTVGFDGLFSKPIKITYDIDTIIAIPHNQYDTTYDTIKYPVDTDTALHFSRTYLLNLGIVEWVNVQAGWADGFTLGFKARLLGETSRGMPSLAIGAHNVFHHKEVNYFKYESGQNISNEFFIALGKSIDPLKVRFHGGLQTMPTVKTEVFNPFLAIEKYFGFGLYTALEMHRRNARYHFHLFGNMRAMDDRFEISAGVVSIESMFFDQNKEFAISLSPHSPSDFGGPGVWIGVRFHARTGLGEKGGFKSIEDRIYAQDSVIGLMRGEIDSLRSELRTAHYAVVQMRDALGAVYDTAEITNIRKDILEKLERLKALYTTDAFDADSVRNAIGRIRFWGERGVAVLKEVLADEKHDRYIRMHAVTVLGIIGNRGVSDVLLDVLGKTSDPDIKIEILIALGKMKETRAMYLMEQLANDPDDAVAMAAQDVLRRLSEQTGAKISPDLIMREVRTEPPETVNENKILPQEQGGKPAGETGTAQPSTTQPQRNAGGGQQGEKSP